jgi:hypothetical protein
VLTSRFQTPTVRGVYCLHPDAPGDWTALLWPDAQQGPWLVRLMWAPVRGRIECIGLEVRGYRETTEEWPPELPLWSGDPPILMTSVLRELPLHSIVTDVRQEMAENSEEFGSWLAEQPGFSAEDQTALRQAWTQPRDSLDVLAEVARVYDEAWASGARPTKAVAEHFTISHSAAAKRVSRARTAGLLPKTTRGKPGGRRRQLGRPERGETR